MQRDFGEDHSRKRRQRAMPHIGSTPSRAGMRFAGRKAPHGTSKTNCQRSSHSLSGRRDKLYHATTKFRRAKSNLRAQTLDLTGSNGEKFFAPTAPALIFFARLPPPPVPHARAFGPRGRDSGCLRLGDRVFGGETPGGGGANTGGLELGG